MHGKVDHWVTACLGVLPLTRSPLSCSAMKFPIPSSQHCPEGQWEPESWAYGKGIAHAAMTEASDREEKCNITVHSGQAQGRWIPTDREPAR